MLQRVGLSLLALALGWGWVAAPSAASSTSVATLQRQLKTAVCLNDWSSAIHHASALMASPSISANDRAELVAFRHQLQEYQRLQSVIEDIPGCDLQLSQYLTTVPTPSQPLQLERALYSVQGMGEPDLTPDQTAQQIMASRQAGLTSYQPASVPELSPALLIGTASGSGVSAGSVSEGVNVFAFVGGQGDRIAIDVNVTHILPGLLYTDDDTELYLFDSEGYLIAANDDFDGLQSRLEAVDLPAAGLYYVAVTTYGNTPLLSPEEQLLGWSNQGGSAIEYTLTITGLTPSAQLALPTPGHHLATQ